MMRSVKSGGRIRMSSDIWSSEGGSESHMKNKSVESTKVTNHMGEKSSLITSFSFLFLLSSLFKHPLWLTKPKEIRCCYGERQSHAITSKYFIVSYCWMQLLSRF